ncbi:MAG: pyruvate kinase [Gemmatimonadota bacterium]
MRTKVVATIGPATRDRDQLLALIGAGVDVVRLNFAHGTHDDHREVMKWVREIASQLCKHVAVLADLAGPKIRIGELAEPWQLVEDTTVVIAPEAETREGELPTTFPRLAHDVKPGDRLLLDDGMLELRCDEVDSPRLRCTVVRGGTLTSHKGINLPGIKVSSPALTEKDVADLDVALEMGVDYVGLSFVQRPEDIDDLRARLPDGVLIVAKIEKDVALGNLEAILTTQMLESMITSPRPTRAEASDVANALFDGTDAVMLSGETAVGRNPVLAVEAMVRIAAEIERSQAYGEGPHYDVPVKMQLRAGATRTEHAIAAATVEAVRLSGAPAIATLTTSGFTTRLVSSYRPPVPVLGVSDDERTLRQLALVWGVHPVPCTEVAYETMRDCAREYLLSHDMGRPGDRLAVTCGVPFHVRGTTNMLRVEEL